MERVNEEKMEAWLRDSLDEPKTTLDITRFSYLTDYIKNNFKPEEGHKKVLDVGCGCGHFVRALKQEGYEAKGIDHNSEIIGLAAQKHGLDLSAGNILALPYQDGAFDMAICFEVLEHVQNYPGVIEEIKRVLKKDGVLLITVPNFYCYDCIEGATGIISGTIRLINKTRKAFKLGEIYKDGYSTHLHKRFPTKWLKSFRESGLELLDQRPILISFYIPENFKPLVKAESFLAGTKPIKKFQTFLTDFLAKIPLLKYSGQTHLFVFRIKG